MSAWPEAVWIVKKLQKNFDFSEQLDYYTRNLNNLNGRVNTLNTTIINMAEDLENTKQIIDLTASVIMATKQSDGNPSSSASYTKGTLWLVEKE